MNWIIPALMCVANLGYCLWTRDGFEALAWGVAALGWFAAWIEKEFK